MTDRRTRKRTVTHTIAPILISLCMAGCEGFVGTGPAQPYTGGAGAGGSSSPSTPSNDAGGGSVNPTTKPTSTTPKADPPKADPPKADPPKADPPSVPSTPCGVAPQKALATLTTYCGNCHSNPATAKAGFSTILNAQALVSSGKYVFANDPDKSLIYKRISAGSMPPTDVAKRPGPDDIAAVKSWIECGAEDWDEAPDTLAFLTIDDRLEAVLDDLRSIPNPVDRERMRYLDVSTLANAGFDGEQVQVYREATSMLLNSLSRGRTVIAPKAVDKAQTLYRLDLRDYLWDAEDWNSLEAEYPYAVIYDEDSRLFPFDETTAEQIREETQTQIPVIQADWFISHTSRPPLYVSLLDLPDTLGGLEDQLGVDIQENIDTEQVLRSGFANAGPSQNNRVIERHELGGNRGALWLSYDFANNLDDKNIFAHPLDFQEDGGEMIFNLDNGLQGYFVANAAGVRLDKAPNNVVQDPASRDGAVETGLSCMNCHQQDGQLPKFDEIRDFQLNAGANAQEIEEVLALYVTQEELQEAFDADQNLYRSARNALKITNVTNTTMHQIDDTHLGIIDLDVVASVIGLPADQLKRAIDASPQALPPEIVTLRTRGGGIQRDSFESIVADLIVGLGLGEPLRVNANGQPINVRINNNVNNNNDDDADDDAADNAGAAGSAANAGAAGAAGSASRNNGGR